MIQIAQVGRKRASDTAVVRRAAAALSGLVLVSCGSGGGGSSARAVDVAPAVACAEQNWGTTVRVVGSAQLTPANTTYNFKFINIRFGDGARTDPIVRLTYGGGRNELTEFPKRFAPDALTVRTDDGRSVSGTQRLRITATVQGERYQSTGATACHLEVTKIERA